MTRVLFVCLGNICRSPLAEGVFRRLIIEAELAEGFDVDTAVDGVDGLAKVRAIKPKLVLLDVMMPRMDGYEVCQTIRADQDLVGVFILILTAKGQKSDELKALEVGADLYMSKPFDDEVVVHVIRDVFEGRLVSQAGSAGGGPVVHYQRV